MQFRKVWASAKSIGEFMTIITKESDKGVDALLAEKVSVWHSDSRKIEILRKPTLHPQRSVEVAELNFKKPCERAFSRIAQEELMSGNELEQKVWLVLGLCGVASILYSVYCFFTRL